MTDTEFETLEWTFDSETGVGTVAIDRPDALNALSSRVFDELNDAFEAFERRDERAGGVAVRAVVVEGTGEEAFSVGADLKEIGRGDADFPGKTGRGHDTFGAIEAFEAPVVGQIDGYCLGGGLELAMACDFRFASERSTFGQPEIHLGLFPGAGATHRLPDLVGRSRAKELMMTGERIDAERAAEEGLVDYVHEASELDGAVAEFVETLAARPPLAVRALKDVVDTTAHLDTEASEQYATWAYRTLLDTEDHREGLTAFFEESDPEWKGK